MAITVKTYNIQLRCVPSLCLAPMKWAVVTGLGLPRSVKVVCHQVDKVHVSTTESHLIGPHQHWYYWFKSTILEILTKLGLQWGFSLRIFHTGRRLWWNVKTVKFCRIRKMIWYHYTTLTSELALRFLYYKTHI